MTRGTNSAGDKGTSGQNVPKSPKGPKTRKSKFRMESEQEKISKSNGSLRSGRQYKAKRNKRIKTAEAKAFTPWPPLFASTSEPHHHGKAALKIIGVRPMSIWWRWGELNPRPKAL